MGLIHARTVFALALACSVLATTHVISQAPSPPLTPGIVPRPVLDPAAVERGAPIYRTACAFCHGIDARGGQGPDLARSLAVLNDEGGRELGEFLKVGRQGNGMPAFPNLSAQEASDLASFLKSRFAESRARPAMDPAGIVVGNAAAGEAYFNGAGGCGSCHSPAGNLKGIGSRYNPMVLQGRMVNPRVVGGGRGGPAPTLPSPKVRVTLPNGPIVSGELIAVSDFFVTLVDAAGNRRTFPRDNEVPKVEIADPLQAHLDMMEKYTDRNLWDLTAYLVTLK